MLAWLMLRPKVIAGIGALALVLSMWSAWKWEVRGLKTQIAAHVQTIAIRDSTIANLHLSISQERLSVTTLTARLREQNAAILQMQSTAQVAEKSAALAVARALAQGRAEAAARLQPSPTVPPGFDALNAESAKVLERP